MSLSNVLHPKQSKSTSKSRQERLLPGYRIHCYTLQEVTTDKMLMISNVYHTIPVVDSQQR